MASLVNTVPLADFAILKENHPEIFRRLLLKRRGISQSQIAKTHGIDPSDLSKVLSGKRKTTHIQKIIADELGLAYGEVWGGSTGAEPRSLV